MNETEYQRWVDRMWQGPLTRAEAQALEEWLARHPEARPAWEEESRLHRAIRQLPDAPLASNFTAQVLQRLDRDLNAATRPAPALGWPAWVRAWLPRFALASLILAAGGAYYWNHHQERQAKFARSMNIADAMAALPAPEALKDFEAINHLTAVSPAPVDWELLAALE